jgi:hypothetical protein
MILMHHRMNIVSGAFYRLLFSEQGRVEVQFEGKRSLAYGLIGKCFRGAGWKCRCFFTE